MRDAMHAPVTCFAMAGWFFRSHSFSLFLSRQVFAATNASLRRQPEVNRAVSCRWGALGTGSKVIRAIPTTSRERKKEHGEQENRCNKNTKTKIKTEKNKKKN